MVCRIRADNSKKVLVFATIMVLALSSVYDVFLIVSAQTTTATLTEWSLPDGGSGPWGIAVDSFGKVWFSENETNRIAMFDPTTNALREWDIPSGGNPKYTSVQSVGSSVRVYFTEYGADRVGFFDNITNTFYEWTLPNCGVSGPLGSGCKPVGIAVDTATGDIWFTEANRGVIGQLNPTSNTLTEYVLPAIPAPGTDLRPWGVAVQRITTVGATNLFVWFTELGNNAIGRLEANSRRLSLFQLSSLGNPFQYQPTDITVDPSGNVIFTSISDQANRISVLRNQTNTVADFVIPTAQSKPTSVRWDPTRNVAWFTEYRSGKVSSLTATGGTFQLVAVTQCTMPGGPPAPGSTLCGSGAQTNTPSIGSASQNVRNFRGHPNPNVRTPTITSITPQTTNQFSEYPLPTTTSAPNSVAVDSAGNVWFTEQQPAGNKIGKMTIVVPFNFGVSASPSSVTVTQGNLANYTVNVSLTSGTAAAVTLSISTSLPSGVTFSFTPVSGNPTFTSSLVIGTATNTPAGTYPLTITATSGALQKTATITLVVSAVPPPPAFDFSLTLTGPTSANLTAGDQASFSVSVNPVGSAAPQSVQLFASGQPAGVAASFNPSTGLPPYTSTLTLETSVDTAPGHYVITITGTGGGQTHQISATVDIKAPIRDFSLSVAPISLNLPQASSGTASVMVESIGVFSAPVTLAASGTPAGMSVSFSPNPTTPSAGGTEASTASIAVTRSVPPGTYTFTITGTSESLVRQVSVTVSVSGCLIATATYGSELSPEVEFLRDFRDYQILRTFAGSNFITAFNAWYYSYSPTVATYIATHQTAKTVMKSVLYPLIGMLHASSATYSLLAFAPELAALSAGMLAGFLIGLVYLAPPLSCLAWLARRRLPKATQRMITKYLAGLLAVLVAGFVISEFLAISSAMMLVSSAIVLTVLVLGGLLPAFRIVDFAERRR